MKNNILLKGLTEEQRAVVEVDLPLGGLAVVQAYAGSGKTSTLKVFAALRPKSRILYLAFNKAMALEAKGKFKGMGHVSAMTIHSLAYQSYGRYFAERIGDIRPYELLPIVKRYGKSENEHCVCWLIQRWIAKYCASAAPTPSGLLLAHADEETMNALRFADIKIDELGHMIDLTWQWIISGEPVNDSPLPFPHNAYLKLMQLNGASLPYDIILVDEAQDVTPCMMDIVLRQNGCKVFVGDTYQQIYGWNGAVDSLEHARELGGEVFHLTQSFRCPKPVAAIADKYLRLLGASKPFRGTTLEKESNNSEVAYICRGNAGVFAKAVSRLEEGPVHFMGGFNGYNFHTLLNIAYLCMDCANKVTDDFVAQFSSASALKEYASEVKDTQLEGRIKLVEQYGAKRIPYLYYEILKNQCGADNADCILSTGHKAKGQEWCYTVLGGDFFDLEEIVVEAEAVGRAEISREELRILYVAITRTYGKMKIPKALLPEDEAIVRATAMINEGKIVFK